MKLRRRLIVTGLLLITVIAFAENGRAEVFEPGSSFQSYTYDTDTGNTSSTYGWTDDDGDTFINSYDGDTGGYRSTIIFTDRPDDDEPGLGQGLLGDY